jgi:hypothetical protein
MFLAAALACGSSAEAAAAQEPQAPAADTAWVNLVSVRRLRDEFAARPAEASFRGGHPRTWRNAAAPVVFPGPFRTWAFTAESYVLLDVDSAGRAAGCRPLREGAHPELDTLGCTLLMRPGYFSASIIPQRESQAGRWVMGLFWESLTTAAHRARPREGGVAQALAPPAGGGAPSQERRVISGSLAASDYDDIADKRITDVRLEAEFDVDPEGVPTSCRVSHSSGNQAVDERTCALLLERVRFAQRFDASGTPIGNAVALDVDIGRALHGPPPPTPVQLGQTVTGRLERGDRTLPNGTFYDEYTFVSPGAMSLRVTLRSAELAPYLWVIHGDPPHVKGKGTDDRSGGTGVDVSMDVPAGATVRIRANAWAAGMQGAYTLQVTAN